MVDLPEKSLQHYAPIVGDKTPAEIRQLASYLQGARVQHINSTAEGGGVAEFLAMLVPLMRDVGLDATWDVMQGSDALLRSDQAPTQQSPRRPPAPDAARCGRSTGTPRAERRASCVATPTSSASTIRSRWAGARANNERAGSGAATSTSPTPTRHPGRFCASSSSASMAASSTCPTTPRSSRSRSSSARRPSIR